MFGVGGEDTMGSSTPEGSLLALRSNLVQKFATAVTDRYVTDVFVRAMGRK